MTERELDRRLTEWLVSREPGPVPDTLRARAARVPYEVRPGLGAMLDVALAAWFPRPMARAGVVLLALLLLAALLVALAVIGSQRPDPRSLVSLSQEAHLNPPPFTMTITVFDIPGDFAVYGGCNQIDEGTVERARLSFFYDGDGRYRYECRIDGAMDTVYVDDGTRHGYQSGRTWIEGTSVASRRIALWDSLSPPSLPGKGPIVEWLNWYDIGVGFADIGRVPRTAPADCSEWTLGEHADVAGRPAWEVACGDDRFWIDEASHLLVKRQLGDRLISEAVEIVVGPVPSSKLFVVEAPAERDLAVSQIASDWTLPLLSTEGGAFSSASLRGRPAVALLHAVPRCWNGKPFRDCLTLDEFADVVGQRSDYLGAVATANQSSWPDDAGLAAAAAIGLPLVADTNAAWHVPFVSREFDPFVVLFDADGRVVAVLDVWSRESLAAALDAFLAGDEILVPPAGDGVFVLGQPAPPLVGPTSEGGTFDLGQVAGRPVVVLAPRIAAFGCTWDGGETDSWITAVGEATRLVGGSARFVALDWAPGRCLERSAVAWAGVPGMSVVGTDLGAPWGALQGPRDYTSMSPDFGRTAIVILDADGVVRQVISDELPTPAELAEMVAAVAAGAP